MFRSRWLPWSAVVFLLGMVCGTAAHLPVRGGTAGWFDPEEQSPRRRAELYEHLSEEVAAFEHHSNIVKTVVRLVGPAVVHIETEKSESFGPHNGSRRYVEEAGSGAVIELDGKNYVLTNTHVIQNAPISHISVYLADGRLIEPLKTWTDPATDVAVMAVEAPGLIAARLGDSNSVEIGDFVLAVGSPFGLSHSVTYGIISAKGRRDLELGGETVRFQDFLQTDAAINPGNSGGPLINLRGEVIGINTAIASNSGGNEGIGFSIPINMVMKIARQLIEHGSVRRAYLGVHLDRDFGPRAAARLGLPRPRGALINGIRPNSPAAQSDLAVGDVILTFDGVEVEDDAHLINIVGLTEVGKETKVTVLRDGKRIELQVRVGDRSQFEQPSQQE